MSLESLVTGLVVVCVVGIVATAVALLVFPDTELAFKDADSGMTLLSLFVVEDAVELAFELFFEVIVGLFVVELTFELFSELVVCVLLSTVC